jgi:hypothetical protein
MTSSIMTGLIGPAAATIGLALCLATAGPASALTMKECGEKYQAAKAAGTLKGMTWNGYRKAECGDDDVSLAEATAAETAASAGVASAKPAKVGRVLYPRDVAPKYANEPPGKARMHTCVDQYNANKASGANGRLKWVTKGGGYFSQCNKRLKS